MEKIFQFLDNNIEVALATVEADRPRIRVFQIMKRVGHTLFFATSQQKHVYSQLQQNPHMEIMASRANVFVRVAGEADFSVPDDIQQAIYRDNPVLQRLYDDYSSLVYFKMEPKEIEYYDLTPTPPITEFYRL